jgi:hypothetical protein
MQIRKQRLLDDVEVLRPIRGVGLLSFDLQAEWSVHEKGDTAHDGPTETKER